MKMHSTMNSDESVSANRFAYVTRYTDRSSRRPKEQMSASKNAQTEYETHLSQNVAYSSTYGPDKHIAYRVNDTEEGQQDVTRNPERTEQRHKGNDTRDIEYIDTRNIRSLRRHRSKSCIRLRLWCLRLCRAKKKCSKHVLKKPTRRVLERIKTLSKECEKPDTIAVAGVSTMPHRESISQLRDTPTKSKTSRRREIVDETIEIADKDVLEDTREERKKRKKREKEERKRKLMAEEEMQEWRERYIREERIPYIMDTRIIDDDLVEDRILAKPPSTVDLAKTCCYLCVQNTLAITAVSKPEQSDKCIQVSAHKFHAETSPTLDKSCSPILLVRTVQSSVKVRTREIGTLCPGTSAMPPGEMGPRAKKRKKFAVFPGLTRTKCPAGRRAACETDKSTAARRDDNAEKREPRNERCCREKNT